MAFLRSLRLFGESIPKTTFFTSVPCAAAGRSSFSPSVGLLSRSCFERFYNRPAWKSRQSEIFQTGASESRALTASIPRKSYLLYGTAGLAAGLMLAGVFADGRRTTSSARTYPSEVKTRVHSAYTYLLGSIASTAGVATYMFKSGLAARIMSLNPWVSLGGSLVLTIGTMMGTQMISYENTLPKHGMWLAFNSCIAASLAPLGYLGGPIVLKAAAVTGCVVGGLSIVGAAAPSEDWLQLRAPLSIGLGIVIGASLCQMFFPASSLLYNISMYGGLAVFGGFVMYDTAKMRRLAQFSPRFDPINASMGVYMDSVNIFVRVAQLLAGGNRRK